MKNCTCTIREEAFPTDDTYTDHATGSKLCDSCDGFVAGPDLPEEPEQDGEDWAADQHNYARQNGDFETF